MRHTSSSETHALTPLDKMKMDIIVDAQATESQRDKANEDMRFVYVAGGMWEGFLESEVDATRVKLELDLVSNPLWRFIGEWTTQRMGVEFKGTDNATSKDDSDLLNGIYRADFRRNSGKMAVDNAVIESATCGYACFKLATRFEDDGDGTNENQTIEWRPIHNAYNHVFWDHSSQRIDKKDARHCTELSNFTRESFEQEFPGKQPSSAYQAESRVDYNVNTRKEKFFSVATRYDVVRKHETVFVYNDLVTGKPEVFSQEDHELIKDELKANQFKKFVRERKVLKQSVTKTVFSGDDILETTRRIPGEWIPIIPVYAYRVYVDGQEWYWGLVRKKKDAQRVFNMQISKVLETAGTKGQRTPIFDPEQMVGDDMAVAWQDPAKKAWLPARALRNKDGSVAHIGPIGYLDPSPVDPNSAVLLDLMPKYISEVSGEMPQEVFTSEMSGKAIEKITKLINLSTEPVNDNRNAAIAHSGEVYQAMAAEIYTTRRMVQTVSRDGADGQSQLQRMVIDDETGKMVMSNDLRGKRFKAYADVGPQYDTMSEQAVEDIKGTLKLIMGEEAAKVYVPILMSLLFKNMSSVGLGELHAFNRKLMLTQGFAEPESDEERKFMEDAKARAENAKDPQAELIAAAAKQQLAEARSLDASSVQKVADAHLKGAQTQKTASEIGTARAKIMGEQLKVIRDQAAQGLQTR